MTTILPGNARLRRSPSFSLSPTKPSPFHLPLAGLAKPATVLRALGLGNSNGKSRIKVMKAAADVGQVGIEGNKKKLN